jgi:hypothetical protein
VVYLRYTVKTTTIKLKITTKEILDRIKENDESYDQVILQLTQLAHKKPTKKELIASYKRSAKQSILALKEWEGADSAWPA